MGGFNNSIANNIDCVFAKNADFSGAANANDLNGLQTNGQVWIGTTALNAGGTHVSVGTFISPGGTIAIGYSFPNVTFDVLGGTAAIETLTVDSGAILTPSGSPENITLTGLVVANATHAKALFINKVSSSVGTLDLQLSAAIASTDVTKVGLASFFSSQFSVDANGFVKSLGSAFAYTNVNHAASPYTVLSTDYYLSVDTSAGVVTLLFPNAPTTNRLFVVKDRTGTSATSNISITSVGGTVTIDGLTTYKLASNFSSIQLLANATPTYEVF